MLKNGVGFKIKALRESKGISQVKLASDSKITAAYLCELESGAKNNPSIDVLARIAAALNVSLSKLLEDNDAVPKASGE
ncbi:MAG: helix-turn-helix domain-containing protein [Bacillota bacterium]